MPVREAALSGNFAVVVAALAFSCCLSPVAASLTNSGGRLSAEAAQTFAARAARHEAGVSGRRLRRQPVLPYATAPRGLEPVSAIIAAAPAPGPAKVAYAPAASPPVVTSPPVVASPPSGVDSALARLRDAAAAAKARHVQAIADAAAQAEDNGAAALREEAMNRLRQEATELGRLTRSSVAQEQLKANITAQAKDSLKQLEPGAVDQATAAAIIGVDHAAEMAKLQSADIAQKLASMQSQADVLVKQAEEAAAKSEAAAKQTQVWASHVPTAEAQQLKDLTESALTTAVRLQVQAEDAAQLDHLVSQMATQAKAAGAEALARSDHAMNMAVEALHQAEINANTVKSIKDITDQIATDAASAAASRAQAALAAAAEAGVPLP